MQRIRLNRQWLAALVLLFLTLSAPARGQPPQRPAATQRPTTGFLSRVYKDESGDHKYVVFVPRAYTPAKKWPVILFLHGAGERGNDGVLPIRVGLGPLVQLREANFPFVVVFPQCEEQHDRILKGWSPDRIDGQRALKILDEVEKIYSIDTKREVLTGWSMGGYGSWEIAARFPDRWLSVVPLSGGGDEAWAEKLKTVPIWAWHGATDRLVRPIQSRSMVDAVKAAGGEPRYTEVPDGDHNVWKEAYDDDALYAWMLSPQSDPAKLPRVTSRPQPAGATQPAPIPELAFVPAVEIPRAAYVRLGNDMLAALADSLPKIVPADALVGRLSDISDYTESQGYGFNVQMYGLSYHAHVVRAAVKAYAKDRLNVQLGLSNVQVTIGGTSLSGDRHSAQAGPISIVIGHQRPVWLSFDVKPEVADRKLRFRLLGTAFSIPSDNWYVSGPAGVSTHGWGMTESKVSNGLVSGLYGKKGTIEQQVASVVPRLIAELEKKVDVNAVAKSATSVWPLPVYEPRLKLWPEEVSTDDKGVSLVLGATAAAVNPAKAPKTVHAVQPVGPAVTSVPQTTKLQAAVAPEMLGPLSQLLVDSGVAHIHVADTHSQELAKLAEVSVISETLPDLKRYGQGLEVRSELMLAGPINIVDAPGQSPQLESTQIKLLVSIKPDASAADFKPCAEFEVTVRQPFEPKLVRPTSLTRAVAFDPHAPAEIEIKGGFVSGYEPMDSLVDIDRLRGQFAAGWDEFFKGNGPPQASIPDIDLGYDKLRAQEIGWAPPSLYAVFGPPGVKITNSSDKPLVYETKGPYSDWGGPYTLKPGAAHDFPITYPMLFRRHVGAGYQMFTLPVGSHSEFRTKVPGTPENLYKAREPAEIQKAVENLPAPEEKKPEEKK